MAGSDPRDLTLQAHVPALMVPRFCEIEWPLDCSGHRYLVAEDGLWIEVKRPWLHLVWLIAPSAALLPYGPVKERMEFAFDWNEFDALVALFQIDAEKALPNEYAAWFVWDDDTTSLIYRPLIAIDAGPAGIKMHRPQLPAHQHLAVDIHSHGTLGACFSATDDADDAGEVKLSAVIGNLDDPAAVSYVIRLCAHGLFIPFEDAAERACRVCGCTDSTPCEGGCEWVEADLCSACAFKEK